MASAADKIKDPLWRINDAEVLSPKKQIAYNAKLHCRAWRLIYRSTRGIALAILQFAR